MGIPVRADEPVLSNDRCKLTNARHPLGRIESVKAENSIRIPLHGFRNDLIETVPVPRETEPSNLAGHDESSPDARFAMRASIAS